LAGGEYWSEALKSFLDRIPVSSVPGALQPSASPGTPIDAPTNLVPYFAPIDARRLGDTRGCSVYMQRWR
jgi:hypothetical protein